MITALASGLVSACICGDNRIKRLLTLLYKRNGERGRGSDGEEQVREEEKQQEMGEKMRGT